MNTPTITRLNHHLVMPGLATAHSHAFQRALRGRTQRQAVSAGSFWSWRGLMYQLAEQLDPDDIFNLSRFAFVELAMSGVTAVGEFHYVHHQPDGTPYPNRTELAEAVIQAAKAAGIRICLIRTVYQRGGFKQPLASAQIRFADAEMDDVLSDVESLQAKFADDPLVNVTVAAHSVRAVPLEGITKLKNYTAERGLPFHMHVAEQRRELEECRAEYHTTPVQLLANAGILTENFVGVHATHLDLAEITALGQAEAFVCLCRTTERDLGDGLPQTAALLRAGAKLCVGVDSHACENAFEEIRAVELDERSRTEQRTVAAEAPYLLKAGTQLGYEAIGMGDAWAEDEVHLTADDPSLAGLADEQLTDGVLFGATPRAVDEVWVNQQRIVHNGVHSHYQEALDGYKKTLHKLSLL